MMTNETIGVTAEHMLCELFRVKSNINPKRLIQNEQLESLITSNFPVYISNSYTFVGHLNKSVDFILDNDMTLSVKTTKTKNNKLCPASIGQISSIKKFNEKFSTDFTCNFDDIIFKTYIQSNADILISKYMQNLFCCDYLFYIDFARRKTHLFTKMKNVLIDKKFISFTRTVDQWNNSVTLKYKNLSIGEFQIHSKRKCFMFRFIFRGLLSIVK